MRPDETFYIITRYREDGTVKWERLSRSKQGYHSTIGSMKPWGYGSADNDTVTLEEVAVTGRNIGLIRRYTGKDGIDETLSGVAK